MVISTMRRTKSLMKSSKALKPCPICGWRTMPIVYGLPTQRDMNRNDIILGGCIIDDLSPDLACSNCDWSGQEWHIGAPLPPSVWIIMDSEGLSPPIGLVAGRYDQICETFLLGYWHNINFTKQYLEWLSSLSEEPRSFIAPFDDLSPGLIAEFRMGKEMFDESDLFASGFQGLAGGPPKFEFDCLISPIN